jgi:hypothetical protein
VSEDSTAESIPDLLEFLLGLLSPKILEEGLRLQEGVSRLVHYTSAENALNILSTRKFWLRNVSCMNDYSEVQHGIKLLVSAFGGEDNPRINRLYGALDKLAPGAAKAAVEKFNLWIPRLPNITFIGCLSLADADDRYGRLSMWRGYSSSKGGVALVLNNGPFLSETDALGAYSLPVVYFTDEEFLEGIDRSLTGLEEFVPKLDKVDAEIIEHTIFWWLLSLAVGCKHPGFNEEREWRILFIPEMFPSDVIEESVASVNGLPQIVQKIPLENDPEKGLIDASPDKLIHRVIIGPSEFPMVQFDAFAKILKDAGIEKPEERISLSLIPLR